MNKKDDIDYDWIGKKEEIPGTIVTDKGEVIPMGANFKDKENMAERIDEWNDPPEATGEVPAWAGLIMLLAILLLGVAIGAYIQGWRPF
jgi:hypothetical protein